MASVWGIRLLDRLQRVYVPLQGTQGLLPPPRECLHHYKQCFKEGTGIYKVEQRKLRAAAQKSDGGGGTESHH